MEISLLLLIEAPLFEIDDGDNSGDVCDDADVDWGSSTSLLAALALFIGCCLFSGEKMFVFFSCGEENGVVGFILSVFLLLYSNKALNDE